MERTVIISICHPVPGQIIIHLVLYPLRVLDDDLRSSSHASFPFNMHFAYLAKMVSGSNVAQLFPRDNIPKRQ